jgi:hypothetical protein
LALPSQRRRYRARNRSTTGSASYKWHVHVQHQCHLALSRSPAHTHRERVCMRELVWIIHAETCKAVQCCVAALAGVLVVCVQCDGGCSRASKSTRHPIQTRAIGRDVRPGCRFHSRQCHCMWHQGGSMKFIHCIGLHRQQVMKVAIGDDRCQLIWQCYMVGMCYELVDRCYLLDRNARLVQVACQDAVVVVLALLASTLLLSRPGE